MKMQITFRGGGQIVVDVDKVETIRSSYTNELVSITWVTPEGWTAKLQTLNVDEVVAVVVLSDRDSAAMHRPGETSTVDGTVRKGEQT